MAIGDGGQNKLETINQIQKQGNTKKISRSSIDVINEHTKRALNMKLIVQIIRLQLLRAGGAAMGLVHVFRTP